MAVPDAVKLATMAERMGKKDVKHEELCRDPAVIKQVQENLTKHAEVENEN